MKILEQFIDMAGKYRVLVDTGAEVIMLKFQKEPIEAAINTEIQKLAIAKAKEPEMKLQQITEQIASLTIQKNQLETEIAKPKEIVK